MTALSMMVDPMRDIVVQMLASYGGLSVAVAIAVAIALVLGILAKIALPAVYGPHSLSSWTLHGICLLFVAVGAKGLHDGVTNPFTKPEK